MSNRLSLDSLKSHLFETLEGVKNLSDPKASENEKISIEQAKAIVDISDSIIDIYKTQVDAVKTFGALDNVNSPKDIMSGLGVLEADAAKAIGY